MRSIKLIFACIGMLIPDGISEVKAQEWPAACQKVEILSTLDQKPQPAYLYKARGPGARPLIVSLHSWSAGYDQKDTLSWMCIDQNYHYIHPHFRGPNNNPEACGSRFAIQDIEDAIAWACENFQVDSTQIHVIGSSGGGYATLVTYMHTQHPIATFSAWVPISDLEKWYYESKGRGNKYALDIARATVAGNTFDREHHYLGQEEARKRSPMYMVTPVARRKQCKLSLYAGVHDGYTGSVPISQSLLFYNKLVKDIDPNATKSLIPEADMLELLASRSFQPPGNDLLGDRLIHYQRTFNNLIQIIIFEGGHEMLPGVALDGIKE